MEFQKTPHENKMAIRAMVRGAYDLQKLRIQTGLRLVATFKVKLGQMPSCSEEDLDADAKQILKELRATYDRLTDGVAKRKFVGEGLIDSLTEFALVRQYVDLDDAESEQFRLLGQALKDVPIYKHFLKDVKGIGPALAGVIVSEIDISKARYPSSLFKFAGLDVGSDGRGRSKRAEHLTLVNYTDAEGKEATRRSITYSPFLKTKLIAVLGSSFLRSKDSPYREIYDGYKNRLENHEVHKDKTKGHRHAMAIRYMVKRFLVDLYKTWRPLEGLPVAPEYSEAKLGMTHRAVNG